MFIASNNWQPVSKPREWTVTALEWTPAQGVAQKTVTILADSREEAIKIALSGIASGAGLVITTEGSGGYGT